MKIVVGLGNPGQRYAKTPHNVGFEVVDRLAVQAGVRWRRSLRFKAHVAEGVVGGQSVLLVKPQTFMNRSGEAVGAIMRYRRMSPGDLIVVLDDADLDVGRLRIRASGGSGGHKGLDSVRDNVGTADFARVRIGVGRRQAEGDLVEHVLTPFPPEERRMIDQVVDRAADAVVCLLGSGLEAAMNAFNT